MGQGPGADSAITRLDSSIVELTEFDRVRLATDALPKEVAEELRSRYSKQVQVEAPSLFNDAWTITPLGWVGFIPLAGDFGISLQPKVELSNLFRMLEYAYSTEFRILEGLTECHSLAEFYERLANVLAKRVLARARRGFYRAYIAESDRLPYLRGRLEMNEAMQRPWDVRLHCHFEEHTGDIEDNQILAWTLHTIARTGLCSERVLPTVRTAYRSLQGLATLRPLSPECCVKRLYHRLNEDYHPLHGLCRFFLEHTGPTNTLGDKSMLPFLINMARLFEKFVAAWLKAHLPKRYALKVQERVEVSDGVLHFDIDLVLYDALRGEAICVLDTKYKAGKAVAVADVAQVVTYAELKGCHEAVLIYPTRSIEPLGLDTHVGRTRVRTLPFALDDNIEEEGQTFLKQLTGSLDRLLCGNTQLA